jgi:hypothetical protein
MADMGGANRIELESQILCSALRLSWADADDTGVFQAARELYQLFPDLLPPPKGKAPDELRNLYGLFELKCDVPQSAVLAAYLKALKKFLREHNVRDNREDYYRLLSAGFVLRKPRLRLSHDLVSVRNWLIDQNVIPDDGTLELLSERPEPQAAQMIKTEPITASLPPLVELLKYAQIIGPAEVQALSNQMQMAPEIPITDLVLSAGYVTEQEMKSLQLAEFLLSQGRITMPQFAVAMYDERTQGVRMAESLQVRGWLETQVSRYNDPKQGQGS